MSTLYDWLNENYDKKERQKYKNVEGALKKIEKKDCFKYLRFIEKNKNKLNNEMIKGGYPLIQDFCTVFLKKYFYSFLNHRPSEYQPCMAPEGLEKLVNFHAIDRIGLGGITLEEKVITPKDISGIYLGAHGGPLLKDDGEYPYFTVPENTYIIFLTELGKYGIQEDKFLEILQDGRITDELLYLLTFDFNDSYLGDIKYLKDRTIYPPFHYCIDSILESTNQIMVDCLNPTFSAYRKINKRKTGCIKSGCPDDKINSPKSEPLAIYKIPIQDISSQIKKSPNTVTPIFIDRTNNQRYDGLPDEDVVTARERLQNQNLIHYTRSTSGHIYYKFNDKREKEYGYVYPSSPCDLKYNQYLQNDKRYTPYEADKMYMCKFQQHDNNPANRTYRVIQDYTAGGHNQIKFSQMVERLKNQFDLDPANAGKKLIIITPKCRSFYNVSECVIENCIRLNNSINNILKTVIKHPSEEAELLKCKQAIQSLYPLGFTTLDKPSSMENIQYKLGRYSKPRYRIHDVPASTTPTSSITSGGPMKRGKSKDIDRKAKPY